MRTRNPAVVTVAVILIMLMASLLMASDAFAGYKSSYRSSYKPTYRSSPSSYSSSSYRSSSSSVSKPAVSKTPPVIISAKPLTGTPSAVLKNPASSAGMSASAKAAGTSSTSKTGAAKTYRSGSSLSQSKGTITSGAKSGDIPPSKRIPGTSGSSSRKPTDFSRLESSAPSSTVRNSIRERSGTDWTTLAMMYWMLSSNNAHSASLSTEDKAWIQRQIQQEENNGQSRESAMQELRQAGVDTSAIPEKKASDSAVEFSWDMPEHFYAGGKWVFLVRATRSGQNVRPDCKLNNAIMTNAPDERLAVKWSAPAEKGVSTEIVCKAWDKSDRRELMTE